MRILFVEDDAAVASVVIRSLKALGASAEWVVNATLAGDALGAASWDAALVDIGLPEGERAGLDLIAAIVNGPVAMSVTALTGTADPKLENDLFELEVGVIKKGGTFDASLRASLVRAAREAHALASLAARVLGLSPTGNQTGAIPYIWDRLRRFSPGPSISPESQVGACERGTQELESQVTWRENR